MALLKDLAHAFYVIFISTEPVVFSGETFTEECERTNIYCQRWHMKTCWFAIYVNGILLKAKHYPSISEAKVRAIAEVARQRLTNYELLYYKGEIPPTTL